MVELNENQKRVVAAGVTVLSLVGVFAFVAFIAWMALRLLALTSAAVVPVLAGFFLALFFKPYYRWLKGWIHNPTVTLLVMVGSVFLPFALVLWYAGALVIDQLTNLISQGPTLIRHVLVWFQSTFPRLYSLFAQIGFPFGDLNNLYAQYGATAVEAGSGALKCLTGLVSVLVTLIFFVFFLMTKDRRGGEIVAHLPFLKKDTAAFLAEQIDAFFDILVSFFQRQTIICLIEGVMYGAGFWLVGLPYGFLVGFTLGVLNLIPLFGSVVCLPIALPLAYFSHDGSLTRLFLVLGVWLVGQVLDGYLITPKIQGDKTGLGYVGVLFSFVFWATLLGPMLGMLLAIPLSAFCVVLWRSLKSKYIKPIV